MSKSKKNSRQTMTESKPNNIEVTDLETIDLDAVIPEEAITDETGSHGADIDKAYIDDIDTGKSDINKTDTDLTDTNRTDADSPDKNRTDADLTDTNRTDTDKTDTNNTDIEEAGRPIAASMEKSDREMSDLSENVQRKLKGKQKKNNDNSLEFIELDEDIPQSAHTDPAHHEKAQPDDRSPARSFLSRINWHIVFLILVLLIIGLVIYRFKTFGKHIDLSQIEGVDENDVLDSILPLIIPKDKEANVVDDGVTTILAFGNAPFADDRESPDNLLNMIGEKTGATVYNCSVENTYLASIKETLIPEEMPIDAFNFYWLTALMCFNDQDNVRYNYKLAFDVYGETPPEGAQEAYDTLTSIDMSKVDVITIMYDASDYMEGLPMYDDASATNIQTYTGNLEAGIELIQNNFPHIRIIVMSAPYAYAIDEEGKYVESDLYRYGEQDVLSTYVIKQFGSAYTRSVTFVDNLYGSITADNAREYLTDNIHLNTKGRELLAERFKYALEYYDKKE